MCTASAAPPATYTPVYGRGEFPQEQTLLDAGRSVWGWRTGSIPRRRMRRDHGAGSILYTSQRDMKSYRTLVLKYPLEKLQPEAFVQLLKA